MKAIFAILSATLLPVCANDPVEIRSPALSWQDSLPLVTDGRPALVLDTAAEIRLRAYPGPWKEKVPSTEPEIRTQVGGMLGPLSASPCVGLEIGFLSGEKPTEFTRSILPAEGVIESVCRAGGAKITRTLLTDKETGAIFIHLLADKPGALSFRVSLGIEGAAPPEIRNRREMIIPPDEKTGRPGAHVRVVPFESDVTPDGSSIIVRGEGEAMILLSHGAESASLGTAFERLGNRHDPGHSPSDPIKIWHGVLESRMKSAENSP
ncbi:hypothetical protein JIN84_00955 [Luteolibacter yonseiensis]|uniref:Uncharacterized protein n=1 Tax=Luteolibacter yonseiensis TaxID=1144680 RepID=A0A934V5P6_9BACT|nr:hypothetical protein [Luteolibacter yonseiensis]MBK1814177.1 hypothetical protein [Luteolibacter yonseiensis]